MKYLFFFSFLVTGTFFLSPSAKADCIEQCYQQIPSKHNKFCRCVVLKTTKGYIFSYTKKSEEKVPLINPERGCVEGNFKTYDFCNKSDQPPQKEEKE